MYLGSYLKFLRSYFRLIPPRPQKNDGKKLNEVEREKGDFFDIPLVYSEACAKNMII